MSRSLRVPIVKKSRPCRKAGTASFRRVPSEIELPPAIGRAIPVGSVAGSALCPVAEPLDLFAHQIVERDDLDQCGTDRQLARFSALVEGQVERLDESLLDLGAGEPFGGVREAGGVVVERVASVLLDHDLPDGHTLFHVGQVDEKLLVEPAFPEELWRKLGHVESYGLFHRLAGKLKRIKELAPAHGSAWPHGHRGARQLYVATR